MGHIVGHGRLGKRSSRLTNYSRDLWNRSVPQLPPEVEFECSRHVCDRGGMKRSTTPVPPERSFLHGARGVRSRGARCACSARRSRAESSTPALRGARSWFRRQCGVRAPAPRTGWSSRRDGAGHPSSWGAHGDGIDSRRVCHAERSDVHFRRPDGFAPQETWADGPVSRHSPCGPSGKGHLAITDRYPGFVRHQLVELGYSEERS